MQQLCLIRILGVYLLFLHLDQHVYFLSEVTKETTALPRQVVTNASTPVPWQNPLLFPKTFLFEEILEHAMNPVDRPLVAKLQNSLRELSKLKLQNDWDKFQTTVRKCTTCRDPSFSLNESWYTAVHPCNGITVRVNDNTGEIQTIQAGTGLQGTQFNSLDLLVPFKGQYNKERLIRLVRSAHDSIVWMNQFRRQRAIQQQEDTILRVRVLFSAHPDDEWIVSNHFIRDIANAVTNTTTTGGKAQAAVASLTIDNYLQVIAIPCNYYNSTAMNQTTTTQTGLGGFQRSEALNVLLDHSCQSQSCIVVGMDVDMTIGPSFYLNAMDFVHPSTTAYFPIIYSQYNPETVELVELERKQNPLAQETIDSYKMDHAGMYRRFGYGMWAMAGSDAVGFRFDTSIKGWGGEDDAFYRVVAESRHTIRMNEPGLIHIWHHKNCTLGLFTQSEKQERHCNKTVERQEGSLFGLYLRDIKEKVSNDCELNSNTTKYL